MKRMLSIILILCLGCLAGTALAEPEVIVPEAYTQNGTLPVYRATARDFSDVLKPELFNQTGIVSRSEWSITFADEAALDWAPEALFYYEYSGTFDANANEEGLEPSYSPRPALSNIIAGLASFASHGGPDSAQVYQLEKTSLTHITVDGAKGTWKGFCSSWG